MNLSGLSDETLLESTMRLATQEREILVSVLHHLCEIGRRRLFSTFGYGSLYTYCVRHLGYSEDQAYRRIAAARLLCDLPAIEDKISEGSLTLSHLSMAQTFFRQSSNRQDSTPFSAEQKLDVISKLENKSTREAQKIILENSCSENCNTYSEKEKVRPVAKNLNEIKIFVTDDVLEKIQTLKGLLAHSNPNMTLSELLDKLCDLGISKWDKAISKSGKSEPTSKKGINLEQKRSSQKTATFKVSCNGGLTETTSMVSQNISVRVRREIWKKADSKCEKCGSRYALQIDHLCPKGLGGSNNSSNLRLLCRSWNQRAAIEVYGRKKMGNYLSSVVRPYLVRS